MMNLWHRNKKGVRHHLNLGRQAMVAFTLEVLNLWKWLAKQSLAILIISLQHIKAKLLFEKWSNVSSCTDLAWIVYVEQQCPYLQKWVVFCDPLLSGSKSWQIYLISFGILMLLWWMLNYMAFLSALRTVPLWKVSAPKIYTVRKSWRQCNKQYQSDTRSGKQISSVNFRALTV